MTTQGSALDAGLLILRIGGAGMLMTHGWGKVQKVLASDFAFLDPLGIGPAPSLILAASAEFLFAALVLLGFKVRWTAIPVAINMAVAGFIFHAADPFGKKELALLYLVVFLALTLTGAGRYSLDSWLAGRRGAGSRRAS